MLDVYLLLKNGQYTSYHFSACNSREVILTVCGNNPCFYGKLMGGPGQSLFCKRVRHPVNLKNYSTRQNGGNKELNGTFSVSHSCLCRFPGNGLVWKNTYPYFSSTLNEI